MKFKQYIPNTLTTLNLFSGLVSLTLIMHGNFSMAAVFIFIAAIFDFLDGTVARLLNAYSELGKQLDSLADIVSFGVAPGILIFQILFINCAGSGNILERQHVIPYFALLIPIFSAIRLAKFNIDLRQENNFIGLPVPANALFFASIPLIESIQPGLFTLIRLDFLSELLLNSRVLAILSVFFSYLLISDFRIFSLKFKNFTWIGNQTRYIFLIISLVLMILFSLNSIPLIIFVYLLLSLFMQRYI